MQSSTLAWAEQKLEFGRPPKGGFFYSYPLQDSMSAFGCRLQHCPLELRIQLQYLHDRLLKDADGPLRNALGRVSTELLGVQRTTLQPADLYALLTPLIDARIETIQSNIRAPGQPLSS